MARDSFAGIRIKLRPNFELEQPAMLKMPEWNGTFGIGAMRSHAGKNCISSTKKFWNQVK
jgi:hypothetical protein